jgi:general secretion pathway protein G
MEFKGGKCHGEKYLVYLFFSSFLLNGCGKSQEQKEKDEKQLGAYLRSTRARIGLFKAPLDSFHMDINRYPSTKEGLNALIVCPADISDPKKWAGPYFEGKIPMDPWNNPYQYASPSKHSNDPDSYDVWSMGPDGINGTGDDIGNWEK